MNSNFLKNPKNNPNSKYNFIKHNLDLSMLNEDEIFSFARKKNRFSNKISKTELDLYKNALKPLNPEHNVFNSKIMDQIKSISKKIYKSNPQEKKQKNLHNILFIEQKYNYIKNNNCINNRNNSLHNISTTRNNNLNQPNKKNKVKNYNSFSNKKNYYFVKNEKEKMILPPINQFNYKIYRIKLNIKNNEDKEQEERMMKLYKELEFINKNKFII